MKKMIFAMFALMASTGLYAQVETTTESSPSDSSSNAAISMDTTATGSTWSDSTATGSSASDTTSQTGVMADSSAMITASADTAGISDEDLKKYAITMDSINSMKQSLLAEITGMVKNNGEMKLARYNDLSKAVNDEAKLKEMKATPAEIAFIQKVTDAKNAGAQKISETFQGLAKDFIGVETYNEVKTALDTDTSLKTRYDEIMTEVQNEGAASNR